MSMLQNSVIVFHKILVMFLLMLVGYLLFRRNILDNHTTSRISTLLNTLIMPCCVLSSFNRSFDPVLARTLALTLVCAIAVFILSTLLAGLLYRPAHPDNYRDCRMCVVFSNNGFMALPLLSAMFGETGVFLGSAHIVTMAVVLWTYGLAQVDKNFRFSAKRILLNPGIIAAVLGLLLFVSPFTLPKDMTLALTHLANLNTPLAMLVLGGYMAQVDLKSCFIDRQVWKASAVRLLPIPAFTMLMLLLIPLEHTAKLTLLVGAAAPSAIAAAMFAQIHGSDYLFSTKTVALSTLLSLVTLPSIIAVMSFLIESYIPF